MIVDFSARVNAENLDNAPGVAFAKYENIIGVLVVNHAQKFVTRLLGLMRSVLVENGVESEPLSGYSGHDLAAVKNCKSGDLEQISHGVKILG